MKKVFIDARHLKSGIGTYIKGLLNEYHNMDLPFELNLIGDKDILGKLYPKFNVVHCTVPIYTIKEQFVLPKLLKNADLFHVPHYNVPVFYRGKMVTTIHDTAHLSLKNIFKSKLKRIYANFFYSRAVWKSKKIFTVSNFSKSEIINYFDITDSKIKVIYNGISDVFTKAKDICDSVLRKYNIVKPYCIYVGNLKPHKNIDVMIKSFGLAKEKYNLKHNLILVGKRDEGKVYNYPSFVKNIEDATFDDLCCLYNSADLHILLSHYEGFGLPPLEAMASGTPTLVSNIPVFREILGESAFYTDLANEEKISEDIGTLLTDDSYRKSKIEIGKEKVREFTWKKAAEETIFFYKKILDIIG